MRVSTAAPEITLTVAKLAASMSSWPKASRQSSELAANASIAISVSNTVLAVTELEFLEGTLVTSSYASKLTAIPHHRISSWLNVRNGSTAEVQQPITLRTGIGSEAEVIKCVNAEMQFPQSARSGHMNS